MRIASVPVNEDLRLQDLYSYEILDSEFEKEFDDLLEVVAQIYGCPMAAISFVDKDRQWFKAHKGLDANLTETSRDISFCSHTILESEVMIIGDAAADDKFKANPLVTESLLIRFYAGAPIVSKAGYKLGAVCVLDNKPRELSQDQAKVLTIISQQISRLLELRLKNKILKARAEEQIQMEKQLLKKALQEHEEERFNISTELHENIAQGLAAVKFYLEVAEESGDAQNELIRRSKHNIESILKQVQHLSSSITPSTLKDFNLKDLLKGLISKFYNDTGIQPTFMYEGRECIDSEVTMAIYRIAECQLSNVKQHSKAKNVTIKVNAYSTLYLAIVDDGIGINNCTFQKGVGINEIISRVESLNGHAIFSSTVKGNCELTVTIPMQMKLA